MISSLFIALIMHNLVIGYGSTYPARRLQQNTEVINPSNGWEKIGTVAQIENLVKTYPANEHEFGIGFNRVYDLVRPVIINAWNKGIIISTVNDYPFGTQTTTLTFGRTLAMKNRDGLETTTDFYRAYYYLTNNELVNIRAINNNLELFVRKTNPWIKVGVLNEITSSLKNKYPYSKYEYGIKYNSALGYIQKITTSNWNSPIKISSIHSYPMGDDANKMRFGKVVFTKNCVGKPKNLKGQEIETSPDNWYHNYYIEEDDTYWYSHGIANDVAIYVRFLGSEYKQIGVLSDLSSLVNKYTPLNFEYATSYNSRSSDTGLVYRPVTENRWDTGSRISTIDNYPFGADLTSLNFGKVVFTQNLLGIPKNYLKNDIETKPNDWYQNYYLQQNDEYYFSNGNANDLPLYVRETNNLWIYIGELSKLDALTSDHSFTEYEYGIQYMCNYLDNTFVRPVTMNRWNRGIRISTVHNYPFGANLNALKFGKIVFTKGLLINPKDYNGKEIEMNQDDWYQNYYYQENDEYVFSNGNANNVKIYVRSMVIKTDNPTKAPTKIPTTKPTAQPTTKIPTTTIPTTKAPTKIPTPFPTFAVCDTNIGLDIAFLIDESGSILPNEFDTLNSFIKRVIEFDINEESFVSLFQYSYKSRFQNILPFTSVASRTNIINAVNNNQQANGGTSTGHAIRETLKYFATNANNNGRPDLLFVLTDGENDDKICDDLDNPIDRKEVEIVLIGIGDSVSLDMFTNTDFKCLYNNVNNDVYMIPQFTQQAFNDKEAALREKTCRESVSAHSMPQFVYNYDMPSKVQPILSPISVQNIIQIVFIALITNLIVYLLIYKCCIQRQLFGEKNKKKHKYEFVENEEDQEEKIKIINDQ